LSAKAYRPDIDGLRAVAVAAVVAFHAFPKSVAGGFVGVDVFFVVSGYLISLIILDDVYRRRFSFRSFYARRIKRIFPALVLVLAASWLFGWFALFANEFQFLGKHVAGGAGFISNFLFWKEAGYFDTAAELKPLLHLWSLGIEEQFYLLWPLLLYLAWLCRMNLLLVCAAVLIASFAANVGTIGHDPVATFYSPLTRVWELMVGAALAWIVLRQSDPRKADADASPRDARLIARELASVLGACLIGFAIYGIDKATPFPGWYALLPVVGTALVIFAGPKAWLNRWILSHPVLVAVGLISYPLYLWHWPLLSFLRITESGSSVALRVAAVVLSVVLAWLTYRLIERPVRFGKGVPAAVPVLCILMVATGYAGYVAFKRNGLIHREANEAMLEGLRVHSIDINVPESTRSPDGSCKSLLGIDSPKNELCLTTSRDPEVLIMGDSHAGALNSAAYLGKVPLKTLVIASHGCLPFASLANHPGRTAMEKNCDEIAAHALRVAAELKSIRTVLINSNDTAYMRAWRTYGPASDEERKSYKWISDPEDPKGTYLDVGAALIDGYARLADTLRGLGKKVVFMIDNPPLGIDPRTCIAPRPLTLSESKRDCVVQRSAVQGLEDYGHWVRQLRQRQPNLAMFDMVAVFCDDHHCFAKGDGRIYYYDGNHLSVGGSQKVLTALEKVLR
jgi:peptidoglycan/LPS O-acetylase OafA/YrhL